MTYRQRANMILGLSFVCFIAIFLWWYTHDVSVWEELLFFVIQSALIGSIADWFAVTALFEKPLGFPYHTELLYRHRDQIIDSMTKIISEKLLQPNMWQDKLYQISFIDKLVGWLRGPDGREKFRGVLYEVAQRAYRYAQKGGTQASIASHIRKYLKQQPLVSFFQDRLISLLEDPNSNMFNDAIGLVRELVNSDDFDSLLEKLILQWREESQHSSMSSLTLTKVLGIVDTHKIGHRGMARSVGTGRRRTARMAVPQARTLPLLDERSAGLWCPELAGPVRRLPAHRAVADGDTEFG